MSMPKNRKIKYKMKFISKCKVYKNDQKIKDPTVNIKKIQQQMDVIIKTKN